MADLLTSVPTGNAPADFLDRTLKLGWLREADPDNTVGAARGGKTAPVRLLRGYSGTGWPDIADAFGDHGFRLHPDAHSDQFPGMVSLCAPCDDGTFLIATVTEGDVAISSHATYENACAWLEVADDCGSQFAWQR